MPVNDTLHNRDIVVVGQQPWDTGIGSNCKNIALEFSKHNRVLYVNSTLDRITLLKHRDDPKVQKRLVVIRGKEKGIVSIQDNLWNLYPDELTESINWIKSRPIFNALNKVNNKKFARSIQKAIHELGFKNIILFNDNDIFRSFYLKELLKPSVSIYYSRDYMLAVDYWKFHGEKLEPELIGKSDLCVANSTYLANYCRKYNPKSYYVGQGCDLEMFSHPKDKNIPADMAALPHPVIGYVGALQSIRLDIALLEYIAKQQPEWNIVLVGPEDDEFRASNLHNIPNVHFLGGKDPSVLPAYINAFDVCLNPQIVNQVTIGNYPRKIDEYLAMGKPTVATATEAMSIFAEHTYLASNKEEYVTLIAKALAEDSMPLQNARREFASTHTWENNVKEIYKAVNEILLPA
ncbi:glycosyl transferase family 1 [Flavipsychrobacter stenotrophus]|uniref:Glycosyl transferase family 1 n=1 Tax=Flavipsychrobacter stenotrophus TaxID=2077091 RepID=A0A2S7T2J1_9BACT|nr:glycosyltransferase [Flavipsychrobacter stenotrophus]PQJ13174.1 glycosyl transferase family 1 [Flavipsychrobacter stenotrophus]